MSQNLQLFDGYEGRFWITPSGCGSSTATALMHIFRPTSLSGKGIRARAFGSHQSLHTTPDPPRFDHIFPEKMSSLLPKKNTGIWSSGALTTTVFPPCPKSASVHLAERAATRVRQCTDRERARAGGSPVCPCEVLLQLRGRQTGQVHRLRGRALLAHGRYEDAGPLMHGQTAITLAVSA